MKLSLKWLKRYLKIQYTPEKIAEMLTTIGLEVEGLDKVESIRGGLRGVVIGQVLTCEKHPDADKLSITTVDIGLENALQIVCGAPNVAAGQKVLVATIGTTLYDGDSKPWTIKKGKIRGAESEGMICAADELGLGSDHSGIIVLPKEANVGSEAASYYGIEDDFIFEIGLTPNRSDATSQLGVARDLLAYLRVHEGFTDDIVEPDLSGYRAEKTNRNISAEVSSTVICPRYTGVTLNDITVTESPEWLKQLLSSIGIKSINNVVDVTNFVLHEYGQPLHAFDADKIQGNKIIVKTLPDQTPFVTLDGVERQLRSEDIMITDEAGNGLCIAGVYGGKGSGVTSETKHVFLEAACFNSKMVRKTSMHHNLRTDAAKIFEKGADANITVSAVKRAATLIQSMSGGVISQSMVDIYPVVIQCAEIRLSYQHVYDLMGMSIPVDTIHDILLSMDMEITPFDHQSILVKVPTNKSDVLRDVDLIEEIVRVYGLDNVIMPFKIQSTISYTVKPNKYQIKETIATYLASNGYNEMMGLSLIESSHYEKTDLDPSSFVYINNTSNIHLNIMRPDMLVSGLQSVAYNLNRQQSNLSLYEMGKAYTRIADGYAEKEFMTIFLTGKNNEESWLTPVKGDVSIYDLKRVVNGITGRLGIQGLQMSELESSTKWSHGLFMHQGPNVLVKYGEVTKSLLTALGIKTKVLYAEIDIEQLVKMSGKAKVQVKEISKFPSVRRDLALVVDKKVSFGEIEAIARQSDKKLLKQINLFDVFSDESKLGVGKKSYAVSFVFEDITKTLNDKEIDNVMDRLTSSLEEKTGAFIRK
jgi:phenylalanyl-tRNA synthetase beta chain